MTATAPLPIPTTLDDLTPAWLTDALRATGHLPPDVSVTSVAAQRIGEDVGFIGLLARLNLTYDTTVDAPAQLIVKLPSLDPGARAIGAMYGLYEREARFYAELAPSAGIATARCYYAGFNASGHVLLLEDLSLVARAGDQVAGATLDESLLVVRELARMHARWWASPQLDAVPWLQRGTDLILQPLKTMYPLLLPRFQELFGPQLKPGVLAVLPGLHERVLALMEEVDARALTLGHGDFRLDNMFFGDEGAPFKLAVVDWQSPNKLNGIFDLSYFVITNQTVDQRRAHDTDLLRAYHDELRRAGIDDLSFDQLLEDYRMSPVAMLALGVINGAMLESQGERGIKLFDAIFERFLTALEDLDSLSLLES